MILLGDVGQADAHFGPFGDSFNLVLEIVLISLQYRCMVFDESRHGKHFGRTPYYS
jgi:hypothetical protein